MIAVPVLLTIVFVVLQLCGVIAWSWLWVLSPLWIGLIVAGIFWWLAVRFIKKAMNLDFWR